MGIGDWGLGIGYTLCHDAVGGLEYDDETYGQHKLVCDSYRLCADALFSAATAVECDDGILCQGDKQRGNNTQCNTEAKEEISLLHGLFLVPRSEGLARYDSSRLAYALYHYG